MTNPAHAGRMLFVNIPVTDLERSKAFFAGLGFTYNPVFTDDTAGAGARGDLEQALGAVVDLEPLGDDLGGGLTPVTGEAFDAQRQVAVQVEPHDDADRGGLELGQA